MLNSQWFEIEENNQTITEILKESTNQHEQGKFRTSEDVIQESKEKYGL